MAKDDSELQTRVEQLEQDNERLRGQLAAAGARPAGVVAAPVYLTEGDRQQLETVGYATIGGKVYDVAGARELLRSLGQEGVEIRDPDPAQQAAAQRVVGALRRDTDTQAVRGVTHVWPSVEPGGIDPGVAGTPGISGPAAGSDEARLAQQTPAANVAQSEPSK